MADKPVLTFSEFEREAREGAERQRLLDMFAAHALIGIETCGQTFDDADKAIAAYGIAEAMMEERDKRMNTPQPVLKAENLPATEDDDGIPF